MTWILIIALYKGGADHVEYPTKEQCEAAAAVLDEEGPWYSTRAFCIPGADWSVVEGYIQE